MVHDLVGEYRQAIRRFAAMNTLDVWYARANVSDLQKLVRSTGKLGPEDGSRRPSLRGGARTAPGRSRSLP